ncbi:MAG: hypothetical protein ACK559_00255, partial [bacterium]
RYSVRFTLHQHRLQLTQWSPLSIIDRNSRRLRFPRPRTIRTRRLQHTPSCCRQPNSRLCTKPVTTRLPAPLRLHLQLLWPRRHLRPQLPFRVQQWKRPLRIKALLPRIQHQLPHNPQPLQLLR